MAKTTVLTGLIKYLVDTALATVVQITDATYAGDPNATKANNEYFNNFVHRYLKALSWNAYTKNTLFVKLDAPADFASADGVIYNTAQAAVDAIPTTGGSEPTANNPYVIIGDPTVSFAGVNWSAHDGAGTRPYIKTIQFNDLAKGTDIIGPVDGFGDPPFTLSNLIQVSDGVNGLGAGINFPQDVIYAMPDTEIAGNIIDRIVGSKNQTSSCLAKAAVYADTGSQRYPGALLLDAGEITFGGSHSGLEYWAAGGLPYEFPTSALVWYCLWFASGTPQIPRVQFAGQQSKVFGYQDPGTLNPQPQRIIGLNVAQAYGAWPSTFPAGATVVQSSGNFPVFYKRYSALG